DYNWLIAPSTSKSPQSTIVVTDNGANNTLITPGHFKVAAQAAAQFGSNVRLPNATALQGRNAANSSWLSVIQANASDQAEVSLNLLCDANVIIGTVGTGLQVKEGTNAKMG